MPRQLQREDFNRLSMPSLYAAKRPGHLTMKQAGEDLFGGNKKGMEHAWRSPVRSDKSGKLRQVELIKEIFGEEDICHKVIRKCTAELVAEKRAGELQRMRELLLETHDVWSSSPSASYTHQFSIEEWKSRPIEETVTPFVGAWPKPTLLQELRRERLHEMRHGPPPPPPKPTPLTSATEKLPTVLPSAHTSPRRRERDPNNSARTSLVKPEDWSFWVPQAALHTQRKDTGSSQTDASSDTTSSQHRAVLTAHPFREASTSQMTQCCWPGN